MLVCSVQIISRLDSQGKFQMFALLFGRNVGVPSEEEWRSTQTRLLCSILQDGACIVKVRWLSRSFEFDFFRDEALILGKYTWYYV